MAEPISTSRHSLFVRRLRLASGLVLLAYVATHLANHALGLVSLAAAEDARLVFLAAWRNLPATALLYTSLLTHMLLALGAAFQRRTLRMPALEAVRIAVGFAIPFLLAGHVVATRLVVERTGVEDTYARIVGSIWRGELFPRQMLLMTLAWGHGCLGLHFVLRYRQGYRARFHFWFALYLLLPVLAALGVVQMARELMQGQAPALVVPPTDQWVRQAPALMLGVFAASIAAVLAGRWLRAGRERRRGRVVTLAYPGRKVTVPLGWSVLEASRAHGIAHLSLCGGRARCSTCRVRVAGEAAHMPVPSEAEQRTLRRIGADAGTRLACQLRPLGDLAVTPLLRAGGSGPPRGRPGVEREVVVLFVDLRRWTTLSEQHLPHDLAYVLDGFFDVVGQAVRRAGGVPNQFIGDSVMALFALESDLATGCRQALTAARFIGDGMAAYNHRLQAEFGQSLGFGIGIHAGHAAVGEVGWQETRTFTAVGDAVNTAARLQELCKAHGVPLVVSAAVVAAAGLDASRLGGASVAIRGRSEALAVFAVANLAGLAGDVPGSGEQ